MGQNFLSIKMLKNNSTLDNSYCTFISLTAEMEAKVELESLALEIQCMADGDASSTPLFCFFFSVLLTVSPKLSSVRSQ